MRTFGRAPIPLPWFLLAKLALLPPFVLLSRAALDVAQGTLPFPRSAPLAALMVVAGLVLSFAAIRNLGRSLRVGLPDEPTEFCQRGLYRSSRNPIYAGIYLSILGSCLLVPSPLNLASSGIAIVLHHWIVLAEERFLDARFGEVWRDYRARVRRYC